MNAKILVSLFVLLAAAGCASMQTEIIADPGAIDSISVGHFTTANPVDDELIGSYLRKELAKRGFIVTDDSPYVLTGTIDVDWQYHSHIAEARIALRGYSDQIVWTYQDDVFWSYPFSKSRKEFARYMAEKIAKQLR